MNTADDFADVGHQLMSGDATEILLRCAASRLYYAAYHICREHADLYCTPLRDEDKQGGNHQQLFTRLKENSKDKKLDVLLQTLSSSAVKMKLVRVDADYKLDRNFSEKDARRCKFLLEELREI